MPKKLNITRRQFLGISSIFGLTACLPGFVSAENEQRKIGSYIVEGSDQFRYIVGIEKESIGNVKTESRMLKFKGLYLGMPINDAKATIKRITGYHWELMQLPTGQHYCFRPEEYRDAFGIYAHRESGKVYKFQFSSMCVDKMFNVYELTPKDFAEAFIDAYKIPRLDWDWDSWAWFYKSPHGFTLIITSEKELVVFESEKHSIDSKPKFD